MGNNILDIHDGGVPIQPYLRRLKDDNTGGVTTYVMVMLGLIFILYLFGFTNMWTVYQTTQVGNTTVSDPAITTGLNIMEIMINALKDNVAVIGGGIFATALFLIIGKITGTAATMLQFLIPVVLMIALNIFVFPFNNFKAEDLSFMGASIATFLFIFLNAFYILAVVEFVRGNA